MKVTNSKLPCPLCDSSDAYHVYEDGHGYCFSCEGYVAPNNSKETTQPTQQKETKVAKKKFKLPTVFAPINSRGLSKKTTQFYGVGVAGKNQASISKHYYPYYNDEGEHIATKVRITKDKSFPWEGNARESTLFGSQLFPKGSAKYLTVTEGEIDAMSAYQLMGSRWPSVSVKDGAPSALKHCKANYDYIDSFDNVVICFDTDKQGKKAAREVAALFGPKAKVVTFSTPGMKDANDFLVNSNAKEFMSQWWNAEAYSPKDIVNGRDILQRLYDRKKLHHIPGPWDGLNKLTYGFRFTEMWTFGAGSGTGKTQVLRELMHHFLKTTDYKIGGLFLEESVEESGEGMMSLHAGVPFHIPDTKYTDEEYAEAHKAVFETGRVHYLEVFGGDFEHIIQRIRYLVKAMDCKIIFLDHISILVSSMGSDGDERRSLDYIADSLKKITVELDVLLIMVSHTKRQSSTPLEEGGKFSLSDLRGTAGIGQLSNFVVGLERDGQADDREVRNTTTIRVVKNRPFGLTGIATYLYYDINTGRLTEIDPSNEAEEGDEEDV